ncbi:cupredoxin domain-containing protein [Pararhodobacter oceanensis]|uniref:EfeO-type cupredoxin-like domain-containing protein n=1 Tax=Pararhodobacter oceanensis TaxID=2172121 RepID=A0A2T8HRD1_9RHOB|nr:cupredoxin family copper-binding protein [Pararhodobacter oceanensis]PVH27975.1 hypothetical protein DDE20_14525 [Pararhodobacter oceanensis]
MPLSRRQFLLAASIAPFSAGLATSANATTTHEVSIEGFAFSPASLSIAAGDTVTFTNNDAAPHTATAQSAGLDTGTLNSGDSESLTFNTPGTFAYRCRFHPAMRGTVTVT